MKTHPIKHNDNTTDKRYEVILEFCGKAERQYVIRFCEGFIGSFETYEESVAAAKKHKIATMFKN